MLLHHLQILCIEVKQCQPSPFTMRQIQIRRTRRQQRIRHFCPQQQTLVYRIWNYQTQEQVCLLTQGDAAFDH